MNKGYTQVNRQEKQDLFCTLDGGAVVLRQCKYSFLKKSGHCFCRRRPYEVVNHEYRDQCQVPGLKHLILIGQVLHLKHAIGRLVDRSVNFISIMSILNKFE